MDTIRVSLEYPNFIDRDESRLKEMVQLPPQKKMFVTLTNFYFVP